MSDNEVFDEDSMAAPDQYTEAPVEEVVSQDPDLEQPTRLLMRSFATAAEPWAPLDWKQALKNAQREWTNPSRSWLGYCQMFVRTVYGVGPLFGSAWLQWLGADDADKHPGGDPDDAPVGSLLCYKGSGPFGHIMLAARPFNDGKSGAWSNDLVRPGKIDKVERDAPVKAWGQKYLGYITSVNNHNLRVKEGKSTRQVPYPALEKAIKKLETALKTAERKKDPADAKAIRKELRHLRKAHSELRKEVKA